MASANDKLSTTSLVSQIVAWVRARIADVTALIPAQASTTNQLADKAFVNSSIATATATFRGTYNLVSDLSLTTSATQSQTASALATKMSALGITPDANDYAFVQIPTDDDTPTEIARIDRYKFDGTAWAFEYSLNNSSFTAAQWAAINSNITSGKVAKLDALPQGVDDVPTAGSNNLVKSGGVHSRLAGIEEELGIPVRTEITENVPVTWAGEGFIRTRTEDDNPEGSAKTWEGSQYSDFIPIDKYTTLTYTRMKSTSASASILAGLSFYSAASASAVLVGKSIPYIANAEESGYENQTIIVPQNAKYIRFSCKDEYIGIFTCEGKYADYIYPDGLGKEVADLQQSLSAEVFRSTAKDTQLEGSVNDLQTGVGGYTTEEITTPINVGAWRDNYAIYATTISEHDIYLGEGHADTNNSATDFVDISSRPSGAQLQYTNILSTTTQSNVAHGLCFYDSQKVAISGFLFEGDALEVSYKLIKIAIPVNAKYVRFSFRINLLSNFSAAFVSEDRVYINGLGKKVDNLSEEVEDIKNTIAPPAEIRITPSICRRRFYLAMTEWCKNHGINDAIIEGAGGFGAGGEVENEVLGHGFANLSVADMTKILYTAYNYPEIENVLAETKHIAYTNGNERAILLESSWMNSDSAKPLTDYYKVMFGKTGGGQANLNGEQLMPENSYCLSAICYHKDFDDCLVLGVVRVKSSSAAKFPVFKQLMDLANKVINNDASASDIATALTNNTDLGHAMAIKIPFGNPRAYHHVDFDSANFPYLIYKKEPQSPQSKLFYPMSMIKVLTVMVVLDYTKDLDVFLTITQEDRDSATSYSSAYSLFEGGEKITIRDLLYASLLPSSNVANYVLARYVGQFLLETYNTNGFIPNN